MNLEMLKMRASIIQRTRDFFIKKSFLEVETPVLSSTLIPDCNFEVFKTDYVDQWSGISRSLFLAPNQDFFMKRIVAQNKCNIFQISKCFRNIEAMTKMHNPEFSMLQFYLMGYNYLHATKIVEELLTNLISQLKPEPFLAAVKPPFKYITMNNAFEKYAGFKLSDAQDTGSLAYHTRNLGLTESMDKPFATWEWVELFEYIFSQHIVPKLQHEGATVIYDFPQQISDLSKNIAPTPERPVALKERCQLFCGGIKIADFRSEKTSANNVRLYFENQSKLKARKSKINHPVDAGYWKIYSNYPECASASIGLDRLICLLTGKTSISETLPFTL
ncbi:MAG: hypothetical protein K5640_05845 [Treponema sp.]|nr:hypothetical protein [Treponema sp.]